MEKQAWKKIFMSRGALIAALVLAVIFAVAYGRAYWRDREIRREIARLQAHVAALQAKKLQGAEALAKVQSAEFLEEAARLKFGLTRPGETAVLVTSTESNEAGTRGGEVTSAKIIIKPSLSIPKKWWYYFFNKQKLYAE